MIIRLSDVTATGRDYDGEIAVEAMEWGVPEDVEVLTPVAYHLHAVRVSGALIITGTLRCEVDCHCRRCDVRCRQVVDERHFDRAWELTTDGQQWVRPMEDSGTEELAKIHEEKALHGKSHATTDMESVDLTEDVREAMILAFPVYPVCRSECKGLCDRCGKNLNEATCECAPPDDNRWAALDQWSAQ